MDVPDEITDDQRRRAESNRVAALAKRKAAASAASATAAGDPWKLFKCRKISPSLSSLPKPQPPLPANPPLEPQSCPPEKFGARLEICSPDSFAITPVAVEGFAYPGEAKCLRRLCDCLSDVMLSHCTQNHGGGKACVYKLRDYDMVLRCLRSCKGVEVEEIPWGTYNVVEKLSHSFVTGRWIPCRPEHLSDEKVDELIGLLPKPLLDALHPYQLDGVKFGLRRGGRCLIADEMGLGKTLQAIAMAGCFQNEGCILVVCPAILRYSWADELERWLPCILPADIHLVFSHQNNPANLARSPKVVVTSYTMLHRLRRSMLEREWALLIVDESHHVRCSKKPTESEEITAVLDVATKVGRIVLLSGTPSLSRPYDIFHQINMLWPGLLGKNKYEFAKTYCALNLAQGYQGKLFQDFSKGVRLEELNVLLKQTVMIRRLKEHVMAQLPPKRRQIVRILLRTEDMVSARASVSTDNCNGSCRRFNTQRKSKRADDPAESCDCRVCSENANQILGIAKLNGFQEWLSIHPIMSGCDDADYMDPKIYHHKMIIFAHHHKVLDGVQDFVSGKGIGFVRIDGNTIARDRQSALLAFKSSKEVKIAIIGLLVCAVGVDFSIAQHVIFLELPKNPAMMQQAEDRAHRQGQVNTVNIYIFCAKDTSDEMHWQALNKSLRRVSSTTNGKYDYIHEFAVEDVCYLERSNEAGDSCQHHLEKTSYEADGTHEQNLENSRVDELSSQPINGLYKDMNFAEGSDRAALLINERSIEQFKFNWNVTKTQDHLSKDDKITYVQKGSASDGQPEGNTFGAEAGSPHPDKGPKNYHPLVEADSNFPNKTVSDKHEPSQQIGHGRSCSDQANTLRFEVSRYTGRIHLYSCIPGKDSRPRPLFENFRPEDLELLDFPATVNGKLTLRFIDARQSLREALLVFTEEWNSLRAIERRKLLGKPLQLPLAVELCYLEESMNHNGGGLLKGRSKQRTTPLCDISQPLPANAVWKKVHLSSGYGRKEKEYRQGWTNTDEPLCKLCQTQCKRDNAKTPEFFEDLFCDLGCYEEYRLRTSNRFLRQELFQIEHGVCTNCQLDCHKLVQHIKPLSMARRQKYIEQVAPKIAKRKKLLDKLISDPIEGNAWHADHIVPVFRGGGECRLENMRTLCVACHHEVTAAQHAERRSERAIAKKQLKVLMSDLRKDQEMGNTGGIDTKLEGQRELNGMEDELLIKVPGSAYSGEQSATLGNEDLEKNSKEE